MRQLNIIFLAGVLAACGQDAGTGGNGGAGAAAGGGQEYVFEELGVAKVFPAEPVHTTGIYEFPYTEREIELTGESVPAEIFGVEQDGIRYRMVVLDMTARAEQAATLMGECLYLNEESSPAPVGTYVHLTNGPRPVYGLRVEGDVHGGDGRLTASCFFENGRLFMMDALVRPEHGELETPEADAFVESVRFLN